MADIRADAIREIDAARMIKQSIAALTDDEDAIRDTLEGETNLHGAIRALVLSITEDAMLRDGAAEAAKKLTERADRFKGRIEAKRELIRLAMEIADWQTREMDVATVTLKRAAPALQVIDESIIPADFFKPGKPKLDSAAVLKALKDGHSVAGATLKNGAPVLAIKTE